VYIHAIYTALPFFPLSLFLSILFVHRPRRQKRAHRSSRYICLCTYTSHTYDLYDVQRHLISWFTSTLNTIMRCIIKERKKKSIVQADKERAATQINEQLRVYYLPWLFTMTSFFACAGSSASTHKIEPIIIEKFSSQVFFNWIYFWSNKRRLVN
jgi:hypothetical protein